MTPHKIVTIHQPNFFPWLGFFNKIKRSDFFVLLDNVQFPKKGGTWTNRVKIIMNGQANWLTVPVERSFHGVRLIMDMQIDNKTDWRNKTLKSISQNYCKAPFFEEIFPDIESMVNNRFSDISSFNIAAIQAISKRIGLSWNKVVIASSLDVKGSSNDLLISITQSLKCNTYMCGGGAGGYQQDDMFAKAGIELIYQNYIPSVYPQFNTKEFVPGLSVIDALMNCGWSGVQKLIKD